jgi:excisionase family DNA binding protein
MVEELLTVSAVADELNVKPRAVNDWMRGGELAYIKLSRTDRRFTRQMLQEFLEARTRNVKGPRETLLDNSESPRLLSDPKSNARSRGGDRAAEDLSRAQLQEEMRSWQ